MRSGPLAGLRVLVTRPEGEGADAWVSALADVGAVPLRFPTVEVVAPESWHDLDAALARLASYDWLLLTSQTSVAFVIGRLPGHRFPDGLHVRIAVVGPKTAQSVEQHGGRVQLVPEDSRQEGLVDALGELPPGTRVLFPLAKGGRTLLSERLSAQGCHVDVVTAYQVASKRELAEPPAFDVATFASPSALRAFVSGVGSACLDGKTVAVIGSTTASEAEKHGLTPVIAEKPDAAALISAITLARNSQGAPKHVVS
jgi:uroporphyrinogen III methyltransferase/synthase